MPVTPRYAPQLQLPPYSYVPGLHPHPVSDPRGHMYGEADDDMEQTEAIAYGFDLFNHGYYWEAHEAWEQVWVDEGREGRFADILKGLIKLAAAGVKAREGRPEGVRRHAQRAEELFRAGRSQGAFCGDWGSHAADVQQAADRLLNTSDKQVVVVFDFQLLLPDSLDGSLVDTTGD